MKIGDRVLVTYSNGEQLVGLIIGETDKMWNIDFDGEEKTRRVRKSMVIVELPANDVPEDEEVIQDIFEDDLELMDEYDDEIPTDEEFNAPTGEPKVKKGAVIAAAIILAVITTLVVIAAFRIF